MIRGGLKGSLNERFRDQTQHGGAATARSLAAIASTRSLQQRERALSAELN